jgi:hypothetical protein
VKEALVKNTISVDRANEILFNQVKTENKKALKDISGKRSQ